MKLFFLAVLIVVFGIQAYGREHEQDKKPLVLSQPQYGMQLFSEQDLKLLTVHDVTLRDIDRRLGSIEGKLDTFGTTIDKDILPTIHVVDFLKWFLAIVVAFMVEEWTRAKLKKRTEEKTEEKPA